MLVSSLEHDILFFEGPLLQLTIVIVAPGSNVWIPNPTLAGKKFFKCFLGSGQVHSQQLLRCFQACSSQQEQQKKKKKTHSLDYVNQGKQINCNRGNKILTAQFSTYITCVLYITGCLSCTCPCTCISGHSP